MQLFKLLTELKGSHWKDPAECEVVPETTLAFEQILPGSTPWAASCTSFCSSES